MARSSIYTGGGKLYFSKINSDGTNDPIMFFGKTDGITLTNSVDWQEHFDTEGCQSVLDARLPSKTTASLKFDTSEITLEMLNRAFLGNIVEIVQAAETDKVIVVAASEVKQGSIVDLGVVNATGATITGKVIDVDFAFDSKTGYLSIIDGGGIATGTSVSVTLATVPAQTRRISAALKTSALLGKFIVVTSSQTGNNYRYTIKNCSVTLSGDFMVKGSEVSTLSFEGSVMIDTGTVSTTLSDYIDIEEIISEAC